MPTRDIHYELEDKVCVVCGSKLKELAPTISEEIIYQPARWVRVRHITHHYICKDCSEKNDEAEIYEVIDVPKKLIPGSVVSPSVVAGLVFNKFVSGIPLYRQEQELKRKKIEIPRANMSNWLMKVANTYLQPIYDKILEDLRRCVVKHMDETTVLVLEDKQEQRSKSYEWLLMSGKWEEVQAVIYDYHPNRDHENAKEILGEEMQGYVQSDGYEAYHKLDGIVSVGCMAHVRRKFVEAMEVSPIHKELPGLSNKEQKDLIEANPSYKNILYILQLIKQLFTHEKEYSEKEYTIEEIQKKRQEQDQGILDELFACFEKHKEEYAPKSKMGVALTYAINQWEYVSNYIKDGRLEISNNRAERAVKPFVIGRKNWLFSNTKRGAHNSSLYYSLVESAKMNQLDIYKYIEYILNELKDYPMSDKLIERLLPYSKELPEHLHIKRAS